MKGDTMYNLLIVDDEFYAVEGIKLGVDWISLGFSGVHEAYTIAQAKEVIQRIPIDVILCDIEMPGGDGFELLVWVRDRYADIEAVFLTCHAEFHFAQKAIQLEIHDYLLKPVNYEELKEVVSGIVHKIRGNRELKQYQTEYQAFWEAKKPLLIEKFWREVLSGSIAVSSVDTLQRSLKEFAVDFHPATMEVFPILISVEHWLRSLTEYDEELMEYAVRKVADEIVLQGYEGCVIQDRHGINVILIYMDHSLKLELADWKRRCETFIHYAEQRLYCKLSCYLGQKTAVPQLKAVYETLLSSEYDNVMKSHAVHMYKPNQTGSRTQMVDLSNWISFIEEGNDTELRQKIHESMLELKFNDVNAEDLNLFYHSVLQATYTVLHKRGKSISEVFVPAEILVPSSIPKTISQLETWCLQVMEVISCSLKQDQNSIVYQVKEYIDAHLHDRIGRMELAELVHLNPAYLSRLFKKETGQSLSDYMTMRKIEAAKELLLTTRKPISEICHEIGYSDLAYFTRVFKKMCQVSPLAYRKRQ